MTDKPVAFITGITGQDGAHLAQHLLNLGWDVYGGFRRGSSNKTWRLNYLNILTKVKLIEFQLSEPFNLITVLQKIKPTHIFHLAAESFVADSFIYPSVALEINTQGTLNLLEAIRIVSPNTKLFAASSSEIFGNPVNRQALDEQSFCYPCNPYGISKLTALHLVRLYREQHGIHACTGILFNHEGPLRGREFVTRKITFNIARLKVEGGKPMNLGDLNSSRDWGAAEDYVAAMKQMLDLDEPDDMIVASGELTSVRDFLKIAAIAAGFQPCFEGSGVDELCTDKVSGQILAQVSPKYFRPHDTLPRFGNTEKIRRLCGWTPSKDLQTLIGDMVEADTLRWKEGLTNV